MKDFAIICAHNPESSNLGMYSVDLAARYWFQRTGASYDLCVTQGGGRVGDLELRRVRSAEDLDGYANLVFWGDFQNNPIWGAADFAYREVKLEGSRSPEEGFETWRRLYLRMPGELPAQVRVYSLGGCFLGANSRSDGGDLDSELQGFLGRCTAILPRDRESARLVRQLLPDDGGRVLEGFDCASLLERAEPCERDDHFLYFFGRTFRRRDAGRLIARLEKSLGIPGRWIRWLGRSVPLLQNLHGRYLRCSDRIARARFVVTDTYHLCINAFLRGTPAIALGSSGNATTETRDDEKKFILYSMIERPELVVDVAGEGRLDGKAGEAVLSRAAELCAESPGRTLQTAGFDRRRSCFDATLRKVLLGNGAPVGGGGLRSPGRIASAPVAGEPRER